MQYCLSRCKTSFKQKIVKQNKTSRTLICYFIYPCYLPLTVLKVCKILQKSLFCREILSWLDLNQDKCITTGLSHTEFSYSFVIYIF